MHGEMVGCAEQALARRDHPRRPATQRDACASRARIPACGRRWCGNRRACVRRRSELHTTSTRPGRCRRHLRRHRAVAVRPGHGTPGCRHRSPAPAGCVSAHRAQPSSRHARHPGESLSATARCRSAASMSPMRRACIAASNCAFTMDCFQATLSASSFLAHQRRRSPGRFPAWLAQGRAGKMHLAEKSKRRAFRSFTCASFGVLFSSRS